MIVADFRFNLEDISEIYLGFIFNSDIFSAIYGYRMAKCQYFFAPAQRLPLPPLQDNGAMQ